MENFDPNKTPKKQILSAQIDLSKFERATDEEKRQQDVMSESTSFFKDGMRKLFKNPLAVLSIVVLAAIILTIIIAPMIVPYGYEEILSVNGKRDKGQQRISHRSPTARRSRNTSTRAARASRTSWAPTSSAATTSSA